MFPLFSFRHSDALTAASEKFWCQLQDMLVYQLKETKIESQSQIRSSEWRPEVPRWRKNASKSAESFEKNGGRVTQGQPGKYRSTPRVRFASRATGASPPALQ